MARLSDRSPSHPDPIGAVELLYIRGMHHDALELAEWALDDRPDDGRLWELKGLIHHARGEATLAMQALETASVIVALQSVGQCALADCYAFTGLRELAQDIYCAMIRYDQTPTPLLRQIARGLSFVRRPDLAIQACRRGITRDPSAAWARYDLGHYMGQCAYPSPMIEAQVRQAIDLDPENTVYRIGLAVFLHRLDRFDEACEFARDVSPQAIASMECSRCTARLLDIYERSEDWRRATLCRWRLTHLRQRPQQRCTEWESDS